jgi:hypothetical protein
MINLWLHPVLEIFYQDYYPGQKRLFLKEKVAWDFLKWGQRGDKMTRKEKGVTDFHP